MPWCRWPSSTESSYRNISVPLSGWVTSTPDTNPTGTPCEYAISRWWLGSARNLVTASGCGGLSKSCPASITRSSSPGPIPLMSSACRGLGGQVDSNCSQSLVQRIKGELKDLALRVAELGDVSRIRRVERPGHQRQAFHQRLLDQRRESLRVFANRFLQDLDAKAHVPRLVACHRGETAVKAAVGRPQLAHGLQLETLPRQSDRRLDDDVVDRHALDERVEVLWVARQALSGGGQAVVEER